MREEEGGERSKERKEEKAALTRGKGEEKETRGGKREMVQMVRMGNKMGTDTGSTGGGRRSDYGVQRTTREETLVSPSFSEY